jgi:hypothetical protein
MKKNLNVILPCCVIGSLLLTQSVQSQITTVELQGVGDQTSDQAPVTTETFDEMSVGTVPSSTSVLGGAASLTGGYVYGANQYGGAGGIGNFFFVGTETGTSASHSATLTFNTPQNYFGMWWSALDGGNSLTVTADGTPYTFTESSLETSYPALAGSSYLGNPNGNVGGASDPGEDFFYIGFLGSDITSVEFDNGSGSGFEMDNFSILAPTVPDMPGTLSLLSLGLSGLAAFGRRFRK